MVKNSWTKVDERRLRSLAVSNTLFFSEIAKKLGKPPQIVRYWARKLGVTSRPAGRKGVWNSKHAHLREPVMRYFLTHSWQETRTRFYLTESELKSLFTVAYRDPKFKHLRKETRRHDAWSLRETKFLLRHAGLQPRTWISKKLSRGGVHAVKEQLNRLNISSKYINGMTYKWACDFFGSEMIGQTIKSKAGPGGGARGDFRYRLIPWVVCEDMAKRSKLKPEIKKLIRAMSRFQRWVHGAEVPGDISKKLNRAINTR